MNKKIQEIEDLLEQSNQLEYYIHEMEVEEVILPSHLEAKILRRIQKRKIKEKLDIYLELSKMVACILLSFFIWQTGVFTKFTSQELVKSGDMDTLYDRLGEVVNKASNFVLNERNVKENQK